MSYLPCVEIEPNVSANSAVIWLHGLGADGNDFAPLAPQLPLPEACHTRFVFPHAPRIPVTINGGMVMRAWYDIREMSIDRKVDVDTLRASAGQVQRLIEREQARGVPAERIVLAGFSQGGAVAYEAALSYGQRLGGLLVLSSYLATAESLTRHPANQALPVLIQHGVYDPVVPEVLGQRAEAQLKAWGYPVRYERYPVEHGVCPEQIPVISRWLGQRLCGE
ncbi:alpha/beta hydrolase [Marinimicrobium sp. C6131]|uniref:alpha/beta hydrolase n=1 Tax=Marinimicrobium sp. C6131 TaxID=3022676 RepID=UPI00223E1D0A|nr:alpha/beta fold hydrolase [Marinimicrobium sp. C6131]UZJ44938.1 alpha/beta hydrolase [Marinimicrobium sp. C6131]